MCKERIGQFKISLKEMCPNNNKPVQWRQFQRIFKHVVVVKADYSPFDHAIIYNAYSDLFEEADTWMAAPTYVFQFDNNRPDHIEAIKQPYGKETKG